MKKQNDYAWLLYAIILAIAVLASSCGDSNESPTIVEIPQTTEYPYDWDSVKYNRIISSIGGETTSIEYDITVKFNEEFIEIVNNEFPKEEPIIWIGGWTDKATFTIDNNLGTIIINHNTGFMTINYNGVMKEIYTY